MSLFCCAYHSCTQTDAPCFYFIASRRLTRIDSRWHSELNNATESVSIALRGEFPSISTIEDICVYMGAPKKLSSKAIGKIGIDTL